MSKKLRCVLFDKRAAIGEMSSSPLTSIKDTDQCVCVEVVWGSVQSSSVLSCTQRKGLAFLFVCYDTGRKWIFLCV